VIVLENSKFSFPYIIRDEKKNSIGRNEGFVVQYYFKRLDNIMQITCFPTSFDILFLNTGKSLVFKAMFLILSVVPLVPNVLFLK
jgi:hypothetical protein